MRRTSISFSHAQVGLIGLALLAGALLRLIRNDQPFSSSDHAELAALVSFFYPRGFNSLDFSGSSTWNLLTSGHGILPVLIGMFSSTLLGLSGVRLNEFWWNLPFALLSLLTIALAVVLVARLAGRAAGVISAFLLALLPIHAALSRTSGISHIPLMFSCQLVTLLCFTSYFKQPTPRRARAASIALSVSLLVELFFPLLFVLLVGAGVLAVETERPGLGARLKRARALLRPRVMLLPLAVLCFNFALLIAYIAGWTTYGGLAARLMEGSDRKGGIYLDAFWSNASFVVGTATLLLLIVLGLFGLPMLRRLELRALPLLWAIIYLAPFVTFTRPNVYGYYLLGIVPLTLNAAVVLSSYFRSTRLAHWLAGATFMLLIGLLALRSLSMIFGLDIAPLIDTGTTQGAITSDQGLKAAAWWIRTHTPPDALIFADAAYEPYQLTYYLHRPFLAVTDARQPEDAYRLLDNAPRRPTFYLIPPGNEPLLRAHVREAPQQIAVVLVDRQPALLIYGYTTETPRTLDAHDANQQFDAQFGDWQAIFAIGTQQ
jgi:4-amino-4-deoxy-L-arabinose transferase-like glycosyltransferase